MAKFGRDMRLKSPGEFTRVFRKARRTGGQGLTILAVENTQGHPRLGMAIAKKHIRLATQRNRIKRIIRESFRMHQQDFPDIDIVVLSRSDLGKRNATEIRQVLMRHWATVRQQWRKV